MTVSQVITQLKWGNNSNKENERKASCIHSCSSGIALSKIFLSGDPRLQNITVKGDIVVNSNGNLMNSNEEWLFTWLFLWQLVLWRVLDQREVSSSGNFVLLLETYNWLDPDQYTAISLPTKIIKLLVSDATNAYMSEQPPVEDAESVEDDEVSFLLFFLY